MAGECCLLVEGASSGADEGTMRRTDPVSCQTLRLWRDAVRDRAASWAAFAVPSVAACEALQCFVSTNKLKGIVEVGAGTGYWAEYLRISCPTLSVLAFDKLPPPPAPGAGKGAGGKGGGGSGGRANEYHGLLPAWGAVDRGDATCVARQHPDRVLLICYPPPAVESVKSCMAVHCCAAFAAAGGRHLALVGEFHGDTGSVTFERQLAAKWTCTAIHELPNWDNTTASLTLWTKNKDKKNKMVAEKKPPNGHHASQAGGRGEAHRWPVACVACGRAPVICDARGGGGGDFSEGGFLRDRMTRSVVVCSETCAQSTLTWRALADAFAAKHLPLPVRGGGGEMMK
jgi:hypothetical protein